MSTRHDDRISVVMPVFNALPFLDEAVESILDQSHEDFEFVIYDDASTDGSRDRLREWAARDSRIRLFEGDRNLGPVGSSALVVERCMTPLVARMDADDLCHRDRLRRQLELLRDHPEAGVVGTLFEIIGSSGERIRGPDYWRLARKSPFVPFAAHGSIMFRRSVFDRAGGYRRECEYWEDQDLIIRMASVADVLVITEPLYKVRQWTAEGRTRDPDRIEDAVDLAYRCLARVAAGRSYDDLLRSSSAAGSKVDPRVFIAAGSKILWTGGRPHVLGRLIKRGRLRPDVRTVTAAVWALWAEASPSTLRAFLRVLLKSKNWLASDFAAKNGPLRWSPSTVSEALRSDCAEDASCYPPAGRS